MCMWHNRFQGKLKQHMSFTAQGIFCPSNTKLDLAKTSLKILLKLPLTEKATEKSSSLMKQWMPDNLLAEFGRGI